MSTKISIGIEGGLLPQVASGKTIKLDLDNLPKTLKDRSKKLLSDAALSCLQQLPKGSAADTQSYNIRLDHHDGSSEFLLTQQSCPDDMLELIDKLFAYAED